MKKALVFSPYLDQIGGGEIYTLQFAKSLEKLRFRVFFAWKDSTFLDQAKSKFNLKFRNPKIDKTSFRLFTINSSVLQKFLHLRQYHTIFFLSDGSIPFLFGQNNYLHFQVPFSHLKPNLKNKVKLQTIKKIICNSGFTKKIIDQKLQTNSIVLYPPINTSVKTDTKKQNQILCVARFTDSLHNKRQDFLIQAFAQIHKFHPKWKLILAGSSTEGTQLVTKLKHLKKELPIKILPNISYRKLQTLYASSKIFWLATGVDIDEDKQPEYVEHFGLATVEAMAAGCVPVVINKGGQKEIFSANKSGFLFNSQNELVTLTQKLITNSQTFEFMQKNATFESRQFTVEKFHQNIKSVLT